MFIRLVAWTPFSLMEYALGVDMDEKFFFGFFYKVPLVGNVNEGIIFFLVINLSYMGACDHGCVYVLL